ncbi:MAG: hypothetical protein GX660_00420, partial [Clostridiaceae bacterium]|nr:hypothetical protein [Clostridiaceae bacterium]
IENKNYIKSVKELFRISFINIFKLWKVIKKVEEVKNSSSYYASSGLFIDNKKLDGAIEFFIKKDCRNNTCSGCGFCEKLADEAVRIIDAPQLEKDTGVFKEVVDMFVEGYYFK